MTIRRRLAPVTALLCAGCLVPQEIEEMEPPREGNDAPRIVLRSPSTSTVVTQRDCPVVFELLGIEDYDRADGLVVRWFVNYGPDHLEPVQETYIAPSPEMVDGIRTPAGDSFELAPRQYASGAAGYLVVEAVVSDGFDPDPEAEPRNRAVLPGKDWDETSWKVTVTEEIRCVR